MDSKIGDKGSTSPHKDFRKMKFGSDRADNVDDSRGAPPSPTGTEHHDDSSRESVVRENLLFEENADLFEDEKNNNSCESRSAGNDVLERVDSIKIDTSAMANLQPPEETADEIPKSKTDQMAGLPGDTTIEDPSRMVTENAHADDQRGPKGEVVEVEPGTTEEVPTYNHCESSGIDPDGSTDCLTSSQSLTPSDTSKQSEEVTLPKDETEQIADMARSETEEGEETHMVQDSTTNDEPEAAIRRASKCDKEPRDAPSAASDLDTASETAEDKDDTSPEKEVQIDLSSGNPKGEDIYDTAETAGDISIQGDISMKGQSRTAHERKSICGDVDASGAIARSNSKPAGIADHYEDSAFFAKTEMEAATSNDSHSSSPVSNSSKRPMDASGRLSVDVEVLQQRPSVVLDPVGDHGKKIVASAAKETPSLNGEASTIINVQVPEPLLTSISENLKQQPLPTPAAAMQKETFDEALKAATEPPDEMLVSSQLPLSLLASRDKESFGLLARGESFRASQQQQQQQQQQQHDHHSQHHEPKITHSQNDPLYGYRINASLVPPENGHRREGSFVAVSRRNSGRHDDLNENAQRVIDDNSHRPLDDNSWRPHPSYPSSPQTFPAPQAIPFNNAGYLLMPQHQMQQMPQHLQPPHAVMGQHPAMLTHQSSFHSQQPQLMARPSFTYATMPAMQPPLQQTMPSPGVAAPGGKRKIRLRLQEEILARPSHTRRSSFFFGRSTRKMMTSQPLPENEQLNEVDRGTISVSWFEGTSSLELSEHVNKSVERKLKLDKGLQLDDIRILDTSQNPPEEIVLCPYIPNGSEFVLRYKLKPASGRSSPLFYGPPDSPSAAPSPYPSMGNLGGLDPSQLASLRKQLDSVQKGEKRKTGKYNRGKARNLISPLKPFSPDEPESDKKTNDQLEEKSAAESDASDADNDSDTLKPESSVDAQLRQITELLLMDKKAQMQRYPKVEKRQVIFVLANYFVLFIAFITLLAEAQARAPGWLSWMENQLENVQNCSADQEALFKCVSNGEFAGLFATVILWISRSATTKQIFLLGFDSPEKLWIVFYESLVGAFCWGVSYMFIRRGMNPDTRPQFLHKYWKDAVYGSLAGFNATFMKAVLKNLIPREAVEEAFHGDKQLKILSWLPSFA